MFYSSKHTEVGASQEGAGTRSKGYRTPLCTELCTFLHVYLLLSQTLMSNITLPNVGGGATMGVFSATVTRLVGNKT